MEKRENETLTARDIKQILNISINAAYNLIHSKSFPVIRIGNSFRVPKAIHVQRSIGRNRLAFPQKRLRS